MSASSRGWGKGWPNCQPLQIVTLKRADGLRLPVHKKIAPIVAYLIDETERRGYDVKPGQTWGFACRPIRGSSSPSNHSWGLAVDINAPSNPMGSRLITDMPTWMVQLWSAHMFRWGGSYKSRPDAMHYEFMGTPADADRIVAEIKAKQSPAFKPNLPLKHQRPFTKNETAKDVQRMLNAWIVRHKIGAKQLPVDGEYDDYTALYVAAFKNWVRKIQRAFGQPEWPNSDTTTGPVTYAALQFWSKN